MNSAQPGTQYQFPTPTLTNSTYFFGSSITEILGWGPTAQIGMYSGPQGMGFYYSGGQGNGVEFAPAVPSFVGGYVNGPFEGPFVNSNFTALINGASAFHDSLGQTVGYGISIGPSVTPVSISETHTNTWITPPANPFPWYADPIYFGGH